MGNFPHIFTIICYKHKKYEYKIYIIFMKNLPFWIYFDRQVGSLILQ